MVFKDKVDTEEKPGHKMAEDEGFFKRFFRDKADDRERKDDKEKIFEEDKGGPNTDDEETSEFFLFRRFFRVHPEEEEMTMPSVSGSMTGSENSSVSDSFFKRLFKERSIEDPKIFSLRREDGMSPSSILKKLFKDKADDSGPTILDEDSKSGVDAPPEGIHKELKNDDILDEKKLSEADVQATFTASSANSTEADRRSPEYASLSTNQKSTEVGQH